MPSAVVRLDPTFPCRFVELAFEVAGRVAGIGELRPHIHRDTAALTIEAAHDQVERTRINIRPDMKRPASAHPRDLQVIFTRSSHRGEVSCPYRVARVLVFRGRRKLSF